MLMRVQGAVWTSQWTITEWIASLLLSRHPTSGATGPCDCAVVYGPDCVHASSLLSSKLAEQTAEQPALPGPCAISSDGTITTFPKAIRALLDIRLLPPQHISNLESLQHSTTDCSLRTHIMAFAEVLTPASTTQPASFTNSPVWRPCASSVIH